jgi:hypothetical protein
MLSLWANTISPSAEKKGRIYYRDIYALTNRMKVFTSIKKRDVTAIKNMINIYLKGEAEL